tara:strand:- start:1163 stop:3481 length:2319 start_codon:yes stop_codon:yes gene_type:complete
MKNFIIFCLLSTYALGYASNPINIIDSKAPTPSLIEKGSFLTSFIEGDQLYLNIPDQILDKPMLFVFSVEVNKSQSVHMQVMWTLVNDKIVLKTLSIKSTAGIIIPLKKGVPLMESILSIFEIQTKYSSKSSYCINITDLILRQDIEWPQYFQAYTESPVSQISLLLGTKNFDNEVIIKTQRGINKNKSNISIPAYFSFFNLSKPMKSRRYDYRMGFWNEEVSGIGVYGTKNSLANITRWRLEKKYKNQKISVPIEPISFILSPEIPKKWRPYVKAGIEEWLPAFEAAGFKDALVVKEVDSLSDWESYSVNNNIVHWDKRKYFRGSEDEEYGGTVSQIIDYRTGEILKSDVFLGSSVQNVENRYFIRAAPLDKRAQEFPFPDEVTGKLYQFLTAHETGHAFGIMDANYGEHTYPLEKMNNVNWLETMGYTPSVMNYTRPNNIVQPEDSIPPTLLIQKVGPTDRYNIQWAYTEFSNETSLEEEEALLENIIRLQDSIPWYRYNAGGYQIKGPAETNEVVETNNPVESTKMALKNLERVIKLLPKACSNEKDNTRLEYLYDKTLNLWYDHMRHVVSLIGGYDIYYKSINQPQNIYTPITLESQKKAIDFLINNAFNPPHWLVNPDFNYKLRYSVHPDRILQYQQELVYEFLRSLRLKRFEYMDSIDGYKGILQMYLAKLQSGLFKELNDNQGNVKPRNQEIQLTYIDKMIRIITQERVNISVEEKAFDYTDYSRGKVMEQLILLKKEIEKEIKKNKKSNSLGHWKLCLKKLNEI